MSEEGIGLSRNGKGMGHGRLFRKRFPYTVPIFSQDSGSAAFSYGIYMHSMGFGFLYPALMAAFIFGGSLEFVVVTMLMSPFATECLCYGTDGAVRHLFTVFPCSRKTWGGRNRFSCF